MTILKALPLISNDLMQALKRRKNGKYRSEKNRKTVAIADMKDILRRYESEMNTEVEKALIYGLNLAIYNKLSDLTNDEFESYITFVAGICNRLFSATEYVTDEESGPTSTDNVREEAHTETDDCTHTKWTMTNSENTRTGCRRISSGMIPYRE